MTICYWSIRYLQPIIVFMKNILPVFILTMLGWPMIGHATVVGYSLTITTAYETVNPFPNRLDDAYTASETGYVQIANTGDTTFTGSAETIAVSAFAGDLSFRSGPIQLSPGDAVSIAIPYDASDVGGFNGPAYFLRPGVEIALTGFFSKDGLSEAVALLVADADIHSGVPRTAPSGLTSDSFVLQGGDPWGFDTSDSFEISQANGVFVFAEAVAEPSTIFLLGLGALGCVVQRRRRSNRLPARNAIQTMAKVMASRCRLVNISPLTLRATAPNRPCAP